MASLNDMNKYSPLVLYYSDTVCETMYVLYYVKVCNESEQLSNPFMRLC